MGSRGVDLSELRSGLIAYFPAIAAGAVAPEAVLRFAGNPNLLRAVSELSPDEQTKLAGGEPLTVVVRHGGSLTHRKLPAHALSAAQIRQVFGNRCIRTETEQIARLESPVVEGAPRKPVTMGSVVVDRSAGTVRIGRVIAPVQEVIDALRAAGLVK